MLCKGTLTFVGPPHTSYKVRAPVAPHLHRAHLLTSPQGTWTEIKIKMKWFDFIYFEIDLIAARQSKFTQPHSTTSLGRFRYPFFFFGSDSS